MEVIKWSDIFDILREVNLLAENNLFISSGACLSGFATKETKVLEPSPFVCLLAPVQEVKAGDVVDAFSIFYKSFINPDEDLINAIDGFYKETEGTEYLFIWAEQFFRTGARNYILNYCTNSHKQKLLEKMLLLLWKK